MEGASALEQRLGHRFHNRSLLHQALVHPSSGVQPDNQRLEFLGDAIFGACLALLIHREKPDWDEGAMTKLRHVLVSTESLGAWARDLDLQLTLPRRGDPSCLKTSFRKPMADAVEAILAAIFLDEQTRGGDAFSKVFHVIEKRFLANVKDASPDAWKSHDAKTELQERAARLNLAPPNYERLGQRGPDHAPLFQVKVTVGPYSAIAEAGNLKLAQAEAARKILELLPASP